MRLKRTEITVETRNLIILRKSSKTFKTLCPHCVSESMMITPETAAIVYGISTRTVYSRLEEDLIHFIETERGTVLVCLHSLLSLDISNN